MEKEEEKERIAQEAKTFERKDNAPTKKVGQGEYASVEDSPTGSQLRNADEVVGNA